MASGKGPWGGGGNSGGSGNGQNGQNSGNNGQRPGQNGGNQVPPEIDDLMRKGQEQLRVLMGGGGKGGPNSGGGGAPSIPPIGRAGWIMGGLLAAGAYLFASFYTVAPSQRGVELFLGQPYRTTTDGPHFAWWPFVRYEVIDALDNKTVTIGGDRGEGVVMLTTDENLVDINFQVVWVISDPEAFYFNLAGQGIEGGRETVAAVAEAAMREVVAQYEFAPIINRERETIRNQAEGLTQQTLDEYNAGIRIVRLNLQTVQSPSIGVDITTSDDRVINISPLDAFRDVQAAEQERDQLQRQADAYANQVLADARGQSAALLEQAEGYRARVINEARGEASRFLAVLEEYQQAPEVTRQRLYLETMERVLGNVDKVVLEGGADGAGSGVVPYLPLNELRNPGASR